MNTMFFILCQPTTLLTVQNHHHHHHGGAIFNYGDMVSLDSHHPTEGTSTEGVVAKGSIEGFR